MSGDDGTQDIGEVDCSVEDLVPGVTLEADVKEDVRPSSKHAARTPKHDDDPSYTPSRASGHTSDLLRHLEGT